jgi:hypothetical protein
MDEVTEQRQHKKRRLVGQSESRDEYQHPMVNWRTETKNLRGKGYLVTVTCPVCQEDRCLVAGSVRHQLRSGRFTGRCSPCQALQRHSS